MKKNFFALSIIYYQTIQQDRREVCDRTKEDERDNFVKYAIDDSIYSRQERWRCKYYEFTSSSSSSQEVPDVWVIPWGFSYGDFSLGSRKDVFSRPGEWSPGVTCTLAKTDFSNPSLWRLLPSLLPTGIVRISVRPRLRLARRMNFANWISWCWQ